MPGKNYFKSLCVRNDNRIFAASIYNVVLFLEKLRRIMKFFLPLLFLTYWGGVTLFTHSHVVNGVIIVHSHPSEANHQHTESQAETILFLDYYVASAVLFMLVAVPCFCALLGLLAVPRRTCLYLSLPEDGIRLRAPPFRVF